MKQTTGKTFSIENVKIYNAEVFFVNFKEGGYVIGTNELLAKPVLGYSKTGHINTGKIPPALESLIDQYLKEIKYHKNRGLAAEYNLEYWKKIEHEADYVLRSPENEKKVKPLLYREGKYNKWGQGTPYNKFTPIKNSHNSWVGCAALSAAQIMWYWQHPKIGTGSKDSINFGTTEYRWDIMPPELTESSTTEEVDAVATLLHHLGVAMKMRYNYPGESLTHPSDIAPAIADQEKYGEIELGHFRYHAVYQDNFFGTAGTGQTAVVLLAELDAGRPVQFNALKPAGHAFVCDGYDSRGETQPLNYYFHFNFGWDGQYDGYFLLSAIGPVHDTDITFIPNYKIVKEIYPIVKSCDETICSGKGECLMVAGIPECQCDEGYEPDNHFRCLKQEGSEYVDEDVTFEDDSDISTDPEYPDETIYGPDDDSVEGIIDNDTGNENGDSTPIEDEIQDESEIDASTDDENDVDQPIGRKSKKGCTILFY